MITAANIILLRGATLLFEQLSNAKGYAVPQSVQTLYQLPANITQEDYNLLKAAGCRIAYYEYLNNNNT